MRQASQEESLLFKFETALVARMAPPTPRTTESSGCVITQISQRSDVAFPVSFSTCSRFRDNHLEKQLSGTWIIVEKKVVSTICVT
jgi:hypothetical protein